MQQRHEFAVCRMSPLLCSQEKVVMPIFPSVLPLCELTDQIATVCPLKQGLQRQLSASPRRHDMRALPYPAVLRYESTRQLNGSRSLKALACTPCTPFRTSYLLGSWPEVRILPRAISQDRGCSAKWPQQDSFS
jgi:hypothetical protein